MNNLEENNVDQSSEEAQPWLMTYADMMTLLFAFFVLLYSMSSPDPEKMQAMEEAMAGETGHDVEQKITLNEIQEEMEEIISSMNLKESISIVPDDRGIAVEMDGAICFASKSETIEKKLEQILDKVYNQILSNKDDIRKIIIEGHSDTEWDSKDKEINFTSNWDLSAARASSVVTYLIDKGVNPGRMQAAGYAWVWPAEVKYWDFNRGKISSFGCGNCSKE